MKVGAYELPREAARKRAREQIWSAPGHSGGSCMLGLFDLQLRWYDFWLKDVANGIDKEPPSASTLWAPDRWRRTNGR